jgi:cytoskeletal protein CcmA (bactofilin family)
MSIFGKPPDANKPAEPVAPGRPAPPPPPPSAAPAPGAPPARPGTCVIGAKTTIKGEISGDEDLVVEGNIEGQVRITRDLRVAPGGVVKATVEAQSLTVSGELVGDCQATGRVEIQATGRLTGNIRAPKIVIAEGAMFRGNSDMSTGRKEERKDAPKDVGKVAVS